MESTIQENTDFHSQIGWYVHLPFCRTKCGYCDFYSLPTIEGLIGDLVWSIREEMALRDPCRPVEAIFIGGGTPTELPPEALDLLLEAVSQHVKSFGEWTVEANPTSTSELKLDLLRRRGVNRISFGAQSFDPEDLRVLERIHDPCHISESVLAARAAGFDHINLDLIYAIPGQTLDRWRETLRRAVDLHTDHLSCYALMYEPGTSLSRLRAQGRIVPSDESLEADMFELTINELTAAGFQHYEISNFAKPGSQCRGNVIYWENRQYLGIGPSAVSYLDGVRRKNVADVYRYVKWMQSDPDAIATEQEQLPPLARAGETAVQMLRLTRGIEIERFRVQTGFDPVALFAGPIEQFTELGLLIMDAHSIRLTRRGMLLANRVMAEFLVDSDAVGAYTEPRP